MFLKFKECELESIIKLLMKDIFCILKKTSWSCIDLVYNKIACINLKFNDCELESVSKWSGG